ncbi:MAG TPA: NAD(P)/FAD-dependent oxidoreductase [Microthrixaceae bacterium]|nr:NAD(P)/FAD-dependent oxidoreductase [Microthrixaceae bacterium]
MDADVVIVGAGPAGASAAIHLARAGRDVVVVDRASFPRDKVCGDGLTTAALRELEDLGVEPNRIDSWIPVSDVWVRSPSGRTSLFPLPDNGAFAAVATRTELDAALVDLARKAGARVLEEHALVSATLGSEAVTVATTGEVVKASFAIGADGMWSPLRKQVGLGLPDYRGEWHAFRQYFGGVTGRAATDLFVFFEPDFLPGYFWSFPLPDGRANVGFGIQRGAAHRVQDMKQLWPDLLARPHISELLGPNAVALEPHRAWPIPARVDSMPAGTGRVVFVGDAVAACDPLTGEGIGQALQTGRFAAEAIDRSFRSPTRMQRTYRERLDRELAPDHRMSMLLIRAVRHRKGARFAIWIASRSDWTRRNFARWLFEDYPRGVITTPRRWSRSMFTRPGAYR